MPFTSTEVAPGRLTVTVGSGVSSNAHTVKKPHWVSTGCRANSELCCSPSRV